MTRTEFSAKVKRQAWGRCQGRCEGCTAKLFPGRFHYDHTQADGLGGLPTLENCKVLCLNCHHEKTVTVDRPIMQKADNIKAKHLGFKPKSRSIGFGNCDFRHFIPLTLSHRNIATRANSLSRQFSRGTSIQFLSADFV